MASEPYTAACLEHSKEHGEAVGIPSHHRTPWRAEERRRNQRLDLNKNRACALHAGKHRSPGGAPVAVGQEQR
jgi:hypothetical protein